MLKISDDKAKEIKKIWLDNAVSRSTMLDLGMWAGTLGSILDINTDVETDYSGLYDDSEYRMSYAEWKVKPMKDKIDYGVIWFEFLVASRNFKLRYSGKEPIEINPEVLGELRIILGDYYKKNPGDPICPPALFAHLLPGYVAPVVESKDEVHFEGAHSVEEKL